MTLPLVGPLLDNKNSYSYTICPVVIYQYKNNNGIIAVMVKILISELLFFDYLELIPFKHSEGVYVQLYLTTA